MMAKIPWIGEVRKQTAYRPVKQRRAMLESNPSRN